VLDSASVGTLGRRCSGPWLPPSLSWEVLFEREAFTWLNSFEHLGAAVQRFVTFGSSDDDPRDGSRLWRSHWYDGGVCVSKRAVPVVISKPLRPTGPSADTDGNDGDPL
jgi:hypothetical protein